MVAYKKYSHFLAQGILLLIEILQDELKYFFFVALPNFVFRRKVCVRQAAVIYKKMFCTIE